MNTLRWLWGMVRNPELVWTDANTGEEFEREQVPRFGGEYLSRWDLRPMWIHDLFTITRGCRCRYRFGIWQTLWCSEHDVDIFDRADES